MARQVNRPPGQQALTDRMYALPMALLAKVAKGEMTLDEAEAEAEAELAQAAQVGPRHSDRKALEDTKEQQS